MGDQQELWPTEVYEEALRHRMLPVARSIVDGESLSSWIVRTADAHGMSTQQLGAWLMGRGRQMFAEDVDRGAWDALTLALARATGQPCAALAQATLRAFEGVLWGEIPRQGTARWVLPVIKRGTLRSGYGVQYCPTCLATDETPHLRLAWRLAFVVACPRHCCLLHDRCDCCGAPVAVHRWRTGALRELGSSGIFRCHACGADRRKPVAQQFAAPTLIAAQARMLAALMPGPVVLEGRAMQSMSFFAGAAMIWSLLDDPRDAQAVWDELDLEVPEFVASTADRYGGYERRALSQRAVLLDGFERLLSSGVEQFVRGLSLRRISSRSLLRYARSTAPAPFWYWSLIREHLDRTMYAPSNGEVDEAIRYQLRLDGGVLARACEVCRLLGMAASGSPRVSRRMQELGVSRGCGRSA